MELSKKLLRIALFIGGIALCQYVIAQDSVAQELCVINEQDSDADEDDLGGADDIDEDGDGLIEICNLEGLNAIRYQLNGSGYRPSSNSEAKITEGCPVLGCIGYELIRDLDFLDDTSYLSVENTATWISGVGWATHRNDCGTLHERL